MMFVDGENLAIRAKEVLTPDQLVPGKHYEPDTFVWMPGHEKNQRITDHGSFLKLKEFAARSYYYTAVQGDEQQLESVEDRLWNLGFKPRAVKKKKGAQAKGVDILLATEALSQSFRNNLDVVVLVAGDGDYVPLVDELQRLGKIVVVHFFQNEGLNRRLRVASDEFQDLTPRFRKGWTQIGTK